MKDFSQYKLLVKKSPPDKRDWKAKTIYPKIVLPEKTNNRVLMLAVRDQGNQGSCVAMAGSAMKEWQEVFDWNLESYLSPQFIYNNREDPSEEGMYMRDLMNILRKKGDCFESLYPYGTNKTITKETFDNALNYIIKNYAAVNSVEELKTALYLNGPCVVAVPVYNYTERMWYKRSGDAFLGGHAMCIVDYDDSRDGFIIRNSWGNDWGDGGYTLMKYEDFNLAYEFWTTIDEKSNPEPEPEPVPDKKSWIDKYWWIVLIGVAVISLTFFILTKNSKL